MDNQMIYNVEFSLGKMTLCKLSIILVLPSFDGFIHIIFCLFILEKLAVRIDDYISTQISSNGNLPFLVFNGNFVSSVPMITCLL